MDRDFTAMANAPVLITTGSSMGFMAALASEGAVVVPHDMPSVTTTQPYDDGRRIDPELGGVVELAEGVVSVLSSGLRLEHSAVRDYYAVAAVTAQLADG